MADLTPNYEFYLPEINGEEAAWGQMLNANWTALDTLLAEVAGLGDGIEEAPDDGQNYVRDGLNNQWNAGLSAAEMALVYLPITPAAGDGIDFSENAGTAADGASTTSQLLNDFEEGDWQINLWDASNSSAEDQGYSYREAEFIRIGNSVIISGYFVMSSLGTLNSGQQVRIGPLPFTATKESACCFSDVSRTVGSVGAISGIIAGGTNFISLFISKLTTGDVQLSVAECGASFSAHFFGVIKI
jgi:hypothetical protein